MTMEVASFVDYMLINAPHSQLFTVGRKKSDYRRLIRNELNFRNVAILGDTPEYISFGNDQEAICRIDYISSYKEIN